MQQLAVLFHIMTGRVHLSWKSIVLKDKRNVAFQKLCLIKIYQHLKNKSGAVFLLKVLQNLY